MFAEPALTRFATLGHTLFSSSIMLLTERQKKFLRGRAHGLRPVVMVGQAGCTEGVIREFEEALLSHELVKVRVRATDRNERDLILANLASAGHAAAVQRIGYIGVFYRAAKT